MKTGLRYKLISFNGIQESIEECESRDNYWLLIGQDVKLLGFSDDFNFGNDSRVLVKFDKDIVKQGLECHNETPNSLWILKTDLK